MDAFFHKVIIACFGIGTILTVLRREVYSDSDKIEGSLGDDWYRIQSFIWSNDVKNSVNEINRFVTTETRRWKRAGSNEPLDDLFSDANKLTVLKDRLLDIKTDYETYLSFNNILVQFNEDNNTLKRWVDIAILSCVCFAVWGLAGSFITLSEITEPRINGLFWNIFNLLIVSAIIVTYKALTSYSRVSSVKDNIRAEKGKFAHVLRGEA